VDDLEVFDDRRCLLGEGPHYDEPTRRVVWVDILGGQVLWRTVDPAARTARGAGRDATDTRPGADPAGDVGGFTVAGHAGAAVPRRGGGLVLCLPDGPVLLGPDGATRELHNCAAADARAGVSRPAGGSPLRCNDAKADPAGRLWLGTMAYDETPGAGALYRLDPGAPGPTRVLGDVTISNGLGWSPDGRTMYYVDSPTGRIDAFDYDAATGGMARRRVFAVVEGPGMPDGLCVDAGGGVWVALWNGAAVHRYSPDGRLDRVVPVPTPQVTSCTFAGDGYRMLVVTTAAVDRPADDGAAGLTYAGEPGDVVGVPVDRYAG
jgi:sugar lactone lactonase YvrE